MVCNVCTHRSERKSFEELPELPEDLAEVSERLCWCLCALPCSSVPGPENAGSGRHGCLTRDGGQDIVGQDGGVAAP